MFFGDISISVFKKGRCGMAHGSELIKGAIFITVGVILLLHTLGIVTYTFSVLIAGAAVGLIGYGMVLTGLHTTIKNWYHSHYGK